VRLLRLPPRLFLPLTQLIYEDYSFLLSIELVNRAQLNKPLLEEEMWYILYSLVKVGSLYERTDRKMGDVQPSNIVINEEGNVKFAGVDAWPNRLDNYQAVCCDRSRPVFLGKRLKVIQRRRSVWSSLFEEATTHPTQTNTRLRSSASV
jgi:hypothetical protein